MVRIFLNVKNFYLNLSSQSFYTFYYFQDWLTVSHPSLKQTTCCFLISGGDDKLTKCNKKASRRVTFALSKEIFSTHFQHVPCGSGLKIINNGFHNFLPLSYRVVRFA